MRVRERERKGKMADAKTPEAVEIVGASPRGTLSAIIWVLFQAQQFVLAMLGYVGLAALRHRGS